MSTNTSSVEAPQTPDSVHASLGGFFSRPPKISVKLHSNGAVEILYQILDAWNLSYSLAKYFIDLLCNNSVLAADTLHNWLVTPEGMIIAACETVCMVGFALLAHNYKKDKEPFKKNISAAWERVRDSLKGLKNAYKGTRTSMQIISIFADQNLAFVVVPVGVTLGVLSALNRIWYRSMKDKRKGMMSKNTALQNHIKSCPSDDLQQEIEHAQAILQEQTQWLNEISHKGYLSQIYGGLIDGLYLYLGVMAITALSPQLFMILLVFSSLFTVLNVVTRAYEEYDYQQKLLASQCETELVIHAQELKVLFKKANVFNQSIQELTDTINSLNESIETLNSGLTSALSPPERLRIEEHIKSLQQQRNQMIKERLAFALQVHFDLPALSQKIEKFEATRKELSELKGLSSGSAVLLGLRNGLAAYSAIASLIFAIAAIDAIFILPFPPVLLIAAAGAGLACLAGFVIVALQQVTNEEAQSAQNFNGIKENISNNTPLNVEAIEQAIQENSAVAAPTKYFSLEWFEVIRSFFSGVTKGQKAVDFTLPSWQEANEAGHFRDSPPMWGFIIGSSILFAVIQSLRALSRMARTPAGAEEPDAGKNSSVWNSCCAFWQGSHVSRSTSSTEFSETDGADVTDGTDVIVAPE